MSVQDVITALFLILISLPVIRVIVQPIIVCIGMMIYGKTIKKEQTK